MGDPLSVAASVVGFISLGMQVTQLLVDFYTSYRDRDSDLAATTKKLESLLDIFQQLKETLDSRRFEADERSLIEKIETTITDCDESIKELQDEYQKFSEASLNGAKNAIRVAARRVTYPFRRSTLQKLDEDVGELRTNVSFALDVLQVKDNKRIRDDIDDTKSLLGLVRASQVSADIRDWLKAPDASINHNAACAKKHPGTGMWLVKSHTFTTWLAEENSLLWLNGFAGSGKSVLCSTAIQFTFRHEDLTHVLELHFSTSPSTTSRSKTSRPCYAHGFYNCRTSFKMDTKILPVYMSRTEPVHLRRQCCLSIFAAWCRSSTMYTLCWMHLMRVLGTDYERKCLMH